MTRELVAVADGVGGWNRKGVDPGIFARELCGHVWAGYRQQVADKQTISLKQLLIDSVAKTKATGTSTFAMALMDEDDALLKTLNLGDSGFMIVRPTADPVLHQQQTEISDNTFEIIFRSKE